MRVLTAFLRFLQGRRPRRFQFLRIFRRRLFQDGQRLFLPHQLGLHIGPHLLQLLCLPVEALQLFLRFLRFLPGRLSLPLPLLQLYLQRAALLILFVKGLFQLVCFAAHLAPLGSRLFLGRPKLDGLFF